MTVGIVAQRDNDRAMSLASTLCDRLRATSAAVVVDQTTAGALGDHDAWEAAVPDSAPVEDMSACDLVVSIGGDGTFLYAARGAGSTPILGVNLGEVGFLNAIAPEEAVETVVAEVEHIQKTGSARTRAKPRLQASGDDWELSPALNEVVVQGERRGHGGGATVDVYVDDSLYTSGHADGVLVATPTGSTAYNLSERGPLVHPDVAGLIITGMADEMGTPPLVVDVDSEVSIELTDANSGVVVSDGRVRKSVVPPERITISRAGEPVRLAGPPLDFFTALDKLA
ncbi:NAD+ kinase [Haloarcula vallismortis]|uniref:NAD kinase n=2 Tax=Haloarcula vallismortis TaxID=28442 RepID=M0IY05_HALVA|nr:NAD(+)/NADH kinase [Haloarcula vallismortis]EMA00948.1 inorganic polyphosphate/ATP-NAD kinase [Haloarcula vallismortis ATCC 29715]SDW10558.1 NAD+ kinase [Haloarcula vallismortis]